MCSMHEGLLVYTTIADFGLQIAVGGNLNVSTRHGCKPPLLRVVVTVKSLIPTCLASSRFDQCITPSNALA
jgi:hypothetical protein